MESSYSNYFVCQREPGKIETRNCWTDQAGMSPLFGQNFTYSIITIFQKFQFRQKQGFPRIRKWQAGSILRTKKTHWLTACPARILAEWRYPVAQVFPSPNRTRSSVRGNSWNQISAASWSEAAKAVAFI